MGGKGLETSAAPLSFYLLQFIWCPVEFMILPPCKGLLYFKSQSAVQLGDRLPVLRPASLPFKNLKGLMSNNDLSPSNRFGKTYYLCSTSAETVLTQSKPLWQS